MGGDNGDGNNDDDSDYNVGEHKYYDEGNDDDTNDNDGCTHLDGVPHRCGHPTLEYCHVPTFNKHVVHRDLVKIVFMMTLFPGC